MAPITTARLATCVVAATLVSAAAVTLPTEALADDGPVSVPTAPVTAPSLDTGAVLAGEASAAVEGAIDDALGEAGQAAPADATSAVAPSAATPVETAPATDPAPVQAPVEPDTTPVPSDTAAGIAIAAAPTARPPSAAAAVQASPTNVNVSVRIGSPGDNGSVTQVNVAAAVATAPSIAGSGTSAPPATAAAAPSTTTAAQTSTPAPQPSTATSSAQDDPETWTWQWNCLSKPDLSVIPAGSTTGSVPKNWTWIWNCGENPVQYQDTTAAQYQPSNMNISIRISSPGNDGPVSQTNVAVAAHVGPLVVVTTPAGSAVVLPVPAPVAEVVSHAVIPGMTSLPALVAAPELVWPGGDVSVRSIVETVDDAVELPYVLPPLPGTGTFRLVERQRLLPGLRGDAVHVGRLAPVGALDLETLSAVVHAEPSSGDGRSAAKGASASRGAKKQTRWRAPLPEPMPAPVPSGASFAPATGGSSSGSGIPIFLALPFLAAMLDLARRVTLDRVALPSGHRSRVPEDPG